MKQIALIDTSIKWLYYWNFDRLVISLVEISIEHASFKFTRFTFPGNLRWPIKSFTTGGNEITELIYVACCILRNWNGESTTYRKHKNTNNEWFLLYLRKKNIFHRYVHQLKKNNKDLIDFNIILSKYLLHNFI